MPAGSFPPALPWLCTGDPAAGDADPAPTLSLSVDIPGEEDPASPLAVRLTPAEDLRVLSLESLPFLADPAGNNGDDPEVDAADDPDGGGGVTESGAAAEPPAPALGTVRLFRATGDLLAVARLTTGDVDACAVDDVTAAV
jgi:hypothetical protein